MVKSTCVPRHRLRASPPKEVLLPVSGIFRRTHTPQKRGCTMDEFTRVVLTFDGSTAKDA
eukprot:1723431-Amphidinium_carterae.1